MEFFDSHAHYNDEKFEIDRKELLDEIYKDGITRIVCAGYNIEQSEFAVNLSKDIHYMYATCGISPNDIEDFVDNNLEKIEKLAQNEKVVAIGEIGLDYYWNKDNKEKQKELFIKQIELANKLNKPIVIHTRDAWIDTIEILKEHPVEKRGVFHCCPLNQELIKEALKLGFYISFSGNVTFKNAKSEECIKLVPLDKILIETDCPYLSPEPFRGKRNDSRKVKLVAKKVAEVKELSVEVISKITYENANKIFGI